MTNQTGIRRPSIVVTFLWAFGILIIGLTIYTTMNWQAWSEWNIEQLLLVIVSIATGLNSIALGALIDMHTLRERRLKKEY